MLRSPEGRHLTDKFLNLSQLNIYLFSIPPDRAFSQLFQFYLRKMVQEEREVNEEALKG